MHRIWVMDAKMQYVDEVKALTDQDLCEPMFAWRPVIPVGRSPMCCGGLPS